MTVAAYAQFSTGGQIIDRREDAVAEIGFGGRAQSDNCSARGETSCLFRCHVRRMDDTPLRVDPGVFQQPLDRARAAPRETIVDFLALLRGVDMDRRADKLRAREGDDLGELLRRYRAKAMRCDADNLLPVSRQFGNQS